ncbi:MAG: hypothetical protein IT328_20020 [Caldilineaceae bacterium]|nr:hypothetical protein [Caldilineaceae bacterium]
MYIRSYYQDITPADVDAMGRHLLAAKAQHEWEIALAQRVAAALQPVAHYRKIDARVAKVVEAAIDESRLRISRTKRHEWEKHRPEYLHASASVGQDYRSRAEYVGVSVTVDINATVADLIAAFEACEYSRAALARVVGQFSNLEEVIDAEEHIRALVKEIEETRQRMAQEIIGAGSAYWHDAVREKLPALTGER